MTNLTTLEYWTEAQGKIDIELGQNNIIETWINRNLNDLSIKTSIEIGCYPGKFLTILGKQGIEVNGIDYIPAVKQLPDVFKKAGYNVGEFFEADFLKYKSKKKYNCVMSFGFIEHGYVIVEVPNFKGFFQQIPRYLFDYKNYKRHNIKSMNLERWNEIIKERGFEIISSEYFGGYELWFEEPITNKMTLKLKQFTIHVLRRVKQIFYPTKKNDKSFSCVMGIIARRKAVL